MESAKNSNQEKTKGSEKEINLLDEIIVSQDILENENYEPSILEEESSNYLAEINLQENETLELKSGESEKKEIEGFPGAVSYYQGADGFTNNANIEIQRPIFLTREGHLLRLAFSYNPTIVEKVKALPFSKYDPSTKTWSVEICEQGVVELRKWFVQEGLTDVAVDSLLKPGEVIPVAPEAILRRGSLKRPFLVFMGLKSDNLFTRLKSLPGAQWERQAQAMSYPPLAAAALNELVSRKIIVDPDGILSPSDLTISFDGRNGKFIVNGDARAQIAFDKNFPKKDILASWREKEFDVAFSDPFAEEVYRGELARENITLKSNLKEELFEYQVKAVNTAVERTGFAIFDAPGVGKTPQAIAWAVELLNRGEANRCIIVTPGAVKTQFAREIMRFTGDTDIVVVDGDKKKRQECYDAAQSAKWVILNYDLLSLDYKLILGLTTGQLLVADEVHKIKSRSSKRGQAMRSLALKANRRLALSGTPVENDPGEWYTIMSGFVVPGIFGSPMEFFNRYSYPGRFGGFEGARNLGELRERSNPHYIRRNKDEVATHLPPLRVKNLVLDPDDKLAAALKRAHRDAQEEIADAAKREKVLSVIDSELSEEVESASAMTAIGMLRLFCSSPRLLWISKAPAAVALCAAGLVPEEDGPKLDELRSLAIEMQSNHERLVVFTSFRTMADLIAERFTQDGIRFVKYTGSSSTKERDKAVLEFNTPGEDGPTVFLATDAAAEGLNLGKCCSTLINFDLAFKPSTMIQRANRIHRVDGDVSKKYIVINYTIAKTIEEGIIQMVGQKADLSDAILGEAGSRRATTGRSGRSVFEQAITAWSE